MSRLYGAVTALIGVIEIVYNVLWLRTARGPYPIPQWLTVFELAWALISIHVLVRFRLYRRAIPLAATYVLYTAFAIAYTLLLGRTNGTVTDEMTPLWYKLLALVLGCFFLVYGAWLTSRKEEELPEEFWRM